MKKHILITLLCAISLPSFAKTIWVDVRTPEEFAQGHVKHASNLPLSDSLVSQIQRAGVNKDDVVLLYCRSGHRAGLAQVALQKAGYAKAQNLGGFADLKASQAVKTTP